MRIRRKYELYNINPNDLKVGSIVKIISEKEVLFFKENNYPGFNSNPIFTEAMFKYCDKEFSIEKHPYMSFPNTFALPGIEKFMFCSNFIKEIIKP